VSTIKQEGTRDSPIALLSDADGDGDDDRTKKKRYITVTDGGKKRKIPDVVRHFLCVH
jgi:hypothetical protein